MSETDTKKIEATPMMYEIPSIKTKTVAVKCAAEVKAKAGHLLFWNATEKKFEAFATSTALDDKTTRAVVLFKDQDFAAEEETTATVIVAGVVYDAFIANAGITSTQIADLASLNSGVTFLDRTEEAIYE